MRLIEDLKWEGKSKLNFLTVFLLFVVFILLFIGGFTRMIFGPTDLSKLDIEKAEGKYVKYKVEINYGPFSEYGIKQVNKIESLNRSYLIWVDKRYYMAVLVQRDSYDLFDKQTAQSLSYLQGHTTEMPIIIEVKGVVKKIEGNPLSHFYSAFPEEFKSMGYVLPYVIDTRAISPYLDSVPLSYCAVGVAFGILGYIIYRYYVIISMKRHDMIVQYIKEHPEEKDDIQSFYDKVPEYMELRMDKNYFLYVGKKGSFFAKATDIVWAYRRIISNQGSKSYGLIISDCHYNAIHVGATEKEGGAIMRYLREGNENIMLGYSEELYDLYSNDMEAFMKLPKTEIEEETE